MTKKEMIEALKYIDDDSEIMVFYYSDGAKLEGVISASLNGSSLQLNCESLENDPQWNEAHRNPAAN